MVYIEDESENICYNQEEAGQCTIVRDLEDMTPVENGVSVSG